ncbi:MAG TPA: exo-alpha-sialidase [Candidatus Hydrogenedentes bacterium]|nr:exo-alpha-sialidase [Candidatus Hydrogenedentota bacterium]
MNLLVFLAALICAATTAPTDEYAFFTHSVIASHENGFNHGLPCIARLADERMLVVWSRYKAGSDDFSVVGAYSPDGGCTWSKPEVFIDHPGLIDADANIIVSENRVLITCTTVSFAEGIRTSVTWCVRSEDSGRTWAPPYEIPMNHKYTCGKCQRGLKLKSGSLLMGYSWDVLCEQGQALQSEGQMDLRAGVMRSTDNAVTWTNGGDTQAVYEKVAGGAVSGTDEPAIVELDDGSLYMLMRTGSTHLYEARSRDEGQSWQDIRPSPLRGTNAPAALSRFSANGRSGVMVVWDHAQERFPLCVAASLDSCSTWSKPKDIGFPYTGGQASYPSCDQAPDGTILAVWQQDVPGGRDIRLARFSPAWLLGDKAAPGAPLKPITIVLFGESTTAPRGPLHNFAKLLEEELPAYGIAPKIINAGLGGEYTPDARERFESAVLAHKPDIVTIYYGLNDAAVDVWKGAAQPRVTAAQFNENLRYFVQKLKEQGAKPILLTPNPLSWTAQLKELYGKPPYDVNDIEGLNIGLTDYLTAVRKLAETEHVPLVDVFKILKEYAKEHSYQDVLLDGMHPNELAHRLIANELLKVISLF